MNPHDNYQVAYTDGSSKGGYGIVILTSHPFVYYISGYLSNVTNNYMELYAIYISLKITSQNLYINSDSMYAINCLTVWYKEWKRNNWKNSKGKDVKNRQLLEDILLLMKDRHIIFSHIIAHSGNFYNEIADKLATSGNNHQQYQIIEKIS